ncbi:MAG TPA: polysaccharide biosynthesis protein [Clostridiales bacterium]|mgnify:CR=1 FL=1|nr:polysaccharide biosynthesis protein [Clostridiales bacterium]
MSSAKKLKTAKTVQTIILFIFDVALTFLASVFTLIVRFEFDFEILLKPGGDGRNFLNSVLYFLPIQAFIVLFVFSWLRLYSILWEYAGYKELARLAFATAIVSALTYIDMTLLELEIPRSFPILMPIFASLFIGGGRLIIRLFRLRGSSSNGKKLRTMIIGAGQTGAMVVREFLSNHHAVNNPVCLIDDDVKKHGTYLSGIPVVGDRTKIIESAKKYKIDEIIFAIPVINAKDKHAILDICQKTDCSLKIIPSLYQLASGEVTIQTIRKVEVEDLLGRDSVKVSMEEISGYVSKKRVLVTGGGGSIGSELCRQIAVNKPEQLIIFDIYENNAYDIEQELKRYYPELNLKVLIGSVRDEIRVKEVFDTYKPEIVYHAAAHKHVPLMETSPEEAIKNNVFGTLNVAKNASSHNVETFVLISTDKAVNPTNIMGASKRICEMIIQTLSKLSETRFVAVRFGNVLGSNGSVIPLFRKQIEKGGPVTVTHPEITRFFMTIPEAVSLVLQAGAYARGGEIFVLDMGDPVKIDTLARNMIKLSGFEPDVDIKIEYTGLRPGEKLYEEILMAEEGLDKTPNNLIFIGHPNEFDTDSFLTRLEELRNLEYKANDEIKNIVASIVSTYHIQD